jgi:hypothetical protein
MADFKFHLNSEHKVDTHLTGPLPCWRNTYTYTKNFYGLASTILRSLYYWTVDLVSKSHHESKLMWDTLQDLRGDIGEMRKMRYQMVVSAGAG